MSNNPITSERIYFKNHPNYIQLVFPIESYSYGAKEIKQGLDPTASAHIFSTFGERSHDGESRGVPKLTELRKTVGGTWRETAWRMNMNSGNKIKVWSLRNPKVDHTEVPKHCELGSSYVGMRDPAKIWHDDYDILPVHGVSISCGVMAASLDETLTISALADAYNKTYEWYGDGDPVPAHFIIGFDPKHKGRAAFRRELAKNGRVFYACPGVMVWSPAYEKDKLNKFVGARYFDQNYNPYGDEDDDYDY